MSISDLNNNDIEILESIIDILEDNEDEIEEDYNNKEDLVSLNKNLKDKIFDFINTKTLTYDKKELVRLAIREYFELEQRDIVVIRENHIIIKLLNDQSIQEVAQKDKDTIAARYNGINEDDLNSFYNDIFLEEDSEEFFYDVADKFVREQLLIKKIDNKTYEQTVFSTIQTIITRKLENSFDHNEEFFKGFSGFVFRMHFKEVFEYIAELILNKLAESNDYIINFLKYYSLSVVIVNAKRYKVPAIEAADGWKWNVASMAPVIKVFIKADLAVYNLENEIHALEKKTQQYHVNNISPIVYNATLNKEIDKIRQEIIYENRRLDAHMSILKDDSLNKTLKEEISDIKHDLQDKHKQVKGLEEKLIAKNHILKYTDLKRELDSKVRYKEREEIVLEKNEKTFNAITAALVKALTSKKILLDK